MTVNSLNRREHSGAPFGRPNPTFLSKSWRVKYGLFGPQDLTPLAVSPYSAVERFVPAAGPGAPAKMTTALLGQDSVTASSLSIGKAVYAGYLNGTFANLTTIANRVGPNPVIVSVSPNGANGARAIDIESGDAVPADAPRFWHNSNHGGTGYGQKDNGIPIYYTSAGDVQAVINELSWAGISRDKYLIWSAHWIGYHICSESVCGYPQADATQYSDAGYVDNDVWYSYCFSSANTSPPPPVKPVSDLPVDWIFQPVRGLTWRAVDKNSVEVSFTSPGATINGHPNMYAPEGIATYDVAVWPNDYIDKATWPGYPISIVPTGSNPHTYTSLTNLNPDSSYVIGIRALAAGRTHASPWAYLSFITTN
jgi:hypothetical protein